MTHLLKAGIRFLDAARLRFWSLVLIAVGIVLMAEISLVIIITEERVFSITMQPVANLQSLDLTRNDEDTPLDIAHTVFVHPGDTIHPVRSVISNVNETVWLERKFNNADSNVTLSDIFVKQPFLKGKNVMAASITIDPKLRLYTIYSYEVIAFDYSHAPSQLSDFRICVIPQSEVYPKGPYPCAPPALARKFILDGLNDAAIH